MLATGFVSIQNANGFGVHDHASRCRNAVIRIVHRSPPFLPDPHAHRFREMCRGCGSQRAVLVVERDRALP